MCSIADFDDHVFLIPKENLEKDYTLSIEEKRQYIEQHKNRISRLPALIDSLLDITCMLKYTEEEIKDYLTEEETRVLRNIVVKSLYTPDIHPQKYLLDRISDYIESNRAFDNDDDPSLWLFDKVMTLTAHQCFALIISVYGEA